MSHYVQDLYCKTMMGGQSCLRRRAEIFDTCVHCFARRKYEEEEMHPSFFPKIFYAEDKLELKYKKDKP